MTGERQKKWLISDDETVKCKTVGAGEASHPPPTFLTEMKQNLLLKSLWIATRIPAFLDLPTALKRDSMFFYPSLYSLCLIGANEEEALNIKVN